MESTCHTTDAGQCAGSFAIRHLPADQAHAIGALLRRALLTQVEGAAVTAVTVVGAEHDFDSLPGVREDVQAIAANLRQLVVRLKGTHQKTLHLRSSCTEVTAEAFEKDEAVELLNPERLIAHLNPGTVLELHVECQADRGFQSRHEALEQVAYESDHVARCPIPADFSPVKRVGYRMEPAEDGSITLQLDVITNGTLHPRDAVGAAIESILHSVRLIRDTIDDVTGDPAQEALGLLAFALQRALLCLLLEGSHPVTQVRLSESGIEIETDGTLTPADALAEVCDLLLELFQAVQETLVQTPVASSPAQPHRTADSSAPTVFGDPRFADQMPHLLAPQRDSYQQLMDQGIAEVLDEFFPVESADGNHKLELQSHSLEPLCDMEQAIQHGKTYAAALTLRLQLSDSEADHTDVFESTVCELPLMTPDGGFVIRGSKRVCVNQLHRSPGVLFVDTEKTALPRAQITPYRGSWLEFEVSANREGEPSGVEARLDRRAPFAATMLLRAFGVETDAAIRACFAGLPAPEQGLLDQTLDSDTTCDRATALVEIHRLLRPDEEADAESAERLFERMLCSPQGYDLSAAGRRQLNRKLSLEVSGHQISVEDIIAVLGRLLAVTAGNAPLDDPESLDERRLRRVGEQMQHRLRVGLHRLTRNAQEQLDFGPLPAEPTQLIDRECVEELIHEFWSSSQFSQLVQQINLLDELTHKRRLSALAPGVDRDSAPRSIRELHDTHRGRICPMETPEGPSCGLITTLANGAVVDDDGFVTAAHAMGEPGDVGGETLGLSSSLIPLIEHDAPSRVLMGANMQRQAVPLLLPEPPIVRSGMEARVVHDSGAAIYATAPGQVLRADADAITLKGRDGVLITYPLMHHRASPWGTSITHQPIVRSNEWVETGQLLADAASSCGGELALGRNLLVAYMPWNGYNSERGIVISERLCHGDTLTSLHIDRVRVEARVVEHGVERLTPHLPGVDEQALHHLDEHGIARVGTRLQPGDILVAKLSPNASERIQLSDLLEGDEVHYVNTSEMAAPHVHGQVIRVQYLSRTRGDELPAGVEEVAVLEIATHRVVQVGDKLSSRHGHKGVVAQIVPEAEMPHLPDGTPMDVLLSPATPRRERNPGQLLETQLGWAAHRLGTTILSPPYEGPGPKEIRELLVQAGLPEDGMAVLLDATSGNSFGSPVVVGYQYLMKLIHLVEDKMHARSIGPYSIVTQQPVGGRAQFGGQRLGEMEVWALEAHGAAYSLLEMLRNKSNATVGLSCYEQITKGERAELVDLHDGALSPTFGLLTDRLRGLAVDLSRFEVGLQIRLASPEQIAEWSRGEVGLDLQGSDGPENATLAELSDPAAMGHVELAVPVAHTWYVRGLPGAMGLLLGIPRCDLERVLAYEAQVVLHSPSERFQKGQVLQVEELEAAQHEPALRVGTGCPAIQELLAGFDLLASQAELMTQFAETDCAQTKRKLRKRLILIRELIHSGVHPDWMMLSVLPVVPQNLRPTVPSQEDVGQEGTVLATSDLNPLYREAIYRNNRLKRLIELDAPESIRHNEARMLQQAVDALLDNGRLKKPVRNGNGRPLQSLTDGIKGKPGMFRSNLLGVRVDYSGRSVITPGAGLKMDECGLPIDMALRLFEPHVIHRLIAEEHAADIREARRLVLRKAPEAVRVLAGIVPGQYVLLNRAPTLRREAIQAFRAVLIPEKAIQLPLLACRAFNADFDGDQMAIHVPMIPEAKQEAADLLAAPNQLISPADGHLLARAPLEAGIGWIYLTQPPEGEAVPPRLSADEVARSLARHECGLHDPVMVEWDGEQVATTAGRVLLNRATTGLWPFVNDVMTEEDVTEIIESVHTEQGAETASQLLDRLMQLGLWAATQLGGSMDAVSQDLGDSTAASISSANGRSVLEHFAEAQVSRRDLLQLVQKMAHQSYLARKLVAAAAYIIVREEDCRTERERGVLACETEQGVCARCYGEDLSTGSAVALGAPIGVVAATSLAERASLLSVDTISQISDLLECKTKLSVNGRHVTAETLLAEQGVEVVGASLVEHVHRIYRENGASVARKHIELIVRLMLSHVSIREPGDTEFLEGEEVSCAALRAANEPVARRGGQIAHSEPLLVSVTEAALRSYSFLAAAGFIQTADVVAKAALFGMRDPLDGLHECVIAGRLIPAGTGFSPDRD